MTQLSFQLTSYPIDLNNSSLIIDNGEIHPSFIESITIRGPEYTIRSNSEIKRRLKKMIHQMKHNRRHEKMMHQMKHSRTKKYNRSLI